MLRKKLVHLYRRARRVITARPYTVQMQSHPMVSELRFIGSSASDRFMSSLKLCGSFNQLVEYTISSFEHARFRTSAQRSLVPLRERTPSESCLGVRYRPPPRVGRSGKFLDFNVCCCTRSGVTTSHFFFFFFFSLGGSVFARHRFRETS